MAYVISRKERSSLFLDEMFSHEKEMSPAMSKLNTQKEIRSYAPPDWWFTNLVVRTFIKLLYR